MDKYSEKRETIKNIIRNNDLNKLNEYNHTIDNIRIEHLNIENSFDLLIYAIDLNASIELIKYLLQNVPYKTINYTVVESNQTKSPLYVALKHNRYKLIQLFIEQYSIDIKNESTELFKKLVTYNDLNENNLKYISQYVVPDDKNSIIDLILRNPTNSLEPIFKQYIYNNAFILDLLESSKKKMALSKEELSDKIRKEKGKIKITESNYLQAMKNNNYNNLKCLYEYDSSTDMLMKDRILHYDLLDVAVKLNDILMVNQLLNYPIFKFHNLASDKLMKEANKNNNMDILKLLIQAQLKSIPNSKTIKSNIFKFNDPNNELNRLNSNNSENSHFTNSCHTRKDSNNSTGEISCSSFLSESFKSSGSNPPLQLNINNDQGKSTPTFGSYRKITRRRLKDNKQAINSPISSSVGFVFNNIFSKDQKKFTFGGGLTNKTSSTESLSSPLKDKDGEGKTSIINGSIESISPASEKPILKPCGFTFGSLDRINDISKSITNIETIEESKESLTTNESKESLTKDETKEFLTKNEDESKEFVLYEEPLSITSITKPSTKEVTFNNLPSNESLQDKNQGNNVFSQSTESINQHKRSGSSRESLINDSFSFSFSPIKKIFEMNKPETINPSYDPRYILTIVNKVIRLGNVELLNYLYKNDKFPTFNINSCDLKGEYPIVVAIQFHQQEIFECIMKYSLIPKDSNNKKYLSLAIQHQLPNVAQNLLDNAICNAMEKDNNNTYPLFLAIEKNNLDIVQILLLSCRQQNQDLNILDDHGNTPLTLAYRRGYQQIFDYLIHYLDINQRDHSNQTILSYAIINNDHVMVEKLIDMGAEINEVIDKNGYSILDLALMKGNKDIILNILPFYPIQKDSDDSQQQKEQKKEKSLIIRFIRMTNCSEEDKIEILQFLIDQGYDVNQLDNSGYYSPLAYAIERRSLAIVKLLIQNNADIHFKYYALKNNSNNNNNNIIKRNLLTLAVMLDEVEIFKYLIDSGLNANPPENDNDTENVWCYTLLHSDNIEIIEYLAKTNINYLKISDIRHAIWNRYSFIKDNKILELLIRHGLDTNMIIKSSEYYDDLVEASISVLNINMHGSSLLECVSKEKLKRKKDEKLN